MGESPFSITYKGSYLDRDSSLVIKIFKRSALSSSLIKIIKKKVRDLCGIVNANMAKVLDGDYGWQGFYFVREYISGRSLAELLKSKPKLDIDEALKIAEGTCEGVKAAHEKGILHGALNPNNVIVNDMNIVKLTDFILVGDMRESIKERSELAFSGSGYLSPEEIMGDTPGFASDIYSVGLMLYVMLSGINPFVGGGGLKTSLNIIKKEPERLKQLRGDVPDYLDAIVMKALDKDPIMRFKSAAGLLSSLKGRTLVAEAKKPVNLPDISIEGLSETIDEEPEEKTTPKEEGRPNFILFLAVIILASVFGVVYAVMSGLLK